MRVVCSVMGTSRARKMPRFDEDQLTVTQQFRVFKKSRQAEDSACHRSERGPKEGSVLSASGHVEPGHKSASNCGEGWYMGGFVPPEGMFDCDRVVCIGL